MKNLLFKAIGSTSASLIQFNIGIGTAIASAIALLFNSTSKAISIAARYMMRALDAELYDYYASVVGQQHELNELNLMMAARNIKEDAMRLKAWTTAHSIAINNIAMALHRNCGWEPPRIHHYLKEVVESIPGMMYSAGDDLERHQ
jgi:hypothetical protein